MGPYYSKKTKMRTLADLLEQDPTDMFARNSSTRIETNNKVTKSTVDDFPLTTGDVIGLTGTVTGAISQMANTINAAKATKPNINHYLGFNAAAVAANQKSKDQLAMNKELAKTDNERMLDISKNTARQRLRGMASGINAMRALDTAQSVVTDNAMVTSNNQIEKTYGDQLLPLLNVDTQLLSQRDQMEMQGETARDLADRQDLDNLFSQFATNLATTTNSIQKLGSDINQAKYRSDVLKILPQTNAWGVGTDKNFNMFAKSGSMVKPFQNPLSAPAANPVKDYKPFVPSITQTPAPVSNIYDTDRWFDKKKINTDPLNIFLY